MDMTDGWWWSKDTKPTSPQRPVNKNHTGKNKHRFKSKRNGKFSVYSRMYRMCLEKKTNISHCIHQKKSSPNRTVEREMYECVWNNLCNTQYSTVQQSVCQFQLDHLTQYKGHKNEQDRHRRGSTITNTQKHRGIFCPNVNTVIRHKVRWKERWWCDLLIV